MIWRAVVGIGALGMTPDEELQMRVGIAPSRRAVEAGGKLNQQSDMV